MKMKKKRKQYLTAGVCGCLLLAAAALPASAADFAQRSAPSMQSRWIAILPASIRSFASPAAPVRRNAPFM